jgi:anti-sigma factor RsiW
MEISMTSYETATRLLPQKPQICNLVEDLLPLYIEGEVSTGSRDLLVDHLAQCEHCAGFLAGAQSMRAQLRNDALARQQVVRADQPAQDAIKLHQRVVRTMLGLIVSGSMLLASGMLASGIGRPASSVGPLLALLAFGALATAAQRRGYLSLFRLMILAVGCIGGAIGGVSVLQPWNDPEVHFFGMLLVIASLACVWQVMSLAPARRGSASG